MQALIVESDTGVTLIGGGEVPDEALAAALARAPRLVAADSGADRALAAGHEPEAVIGDLDSLSREARDRLAHRLHPITEQETTDFDKALRSIAAPFVLAVGFTGPRIDHMLGVFNALARHPRRTCLVLGRRDVCFLAPETLRLRLDPGTRLSLFPLGAVTGESEGLRWPIGGIDFAPAGPDGLSNEVSAPDVRLRLSARRMLVLLPLGALDAALAALGAAQGRSGAPAG